MKALDDRVLVAGQIRPGDMAAIAAAGVTLVVNNRPDGEEPGQPPAADIEAAARAAGLDYRFIPIAGGLQAEAVEATAQALEAADGKSLLFCGSGTRSTYLWALARARRGADAGPLLSAAAAAGYDLRPLLPRLR
ncbi:MAG TPA: TIGR01244 family sulfur transferase [Allosphingosinicella sp.]|jgi:uncharacterized protein (TIGR01244 family)